MTKKYFYERRKCDEQQKNLFSKTGFKKNKKLFINVNLILSKIVDKSVDNFQKKIFNLADNFFCAKKN